jgi:hypothetical protein
MAEARYEGHDVRRLIAVFTDERLRNLIVGRVLAVDVEQRLERRIVVGVRDRSARRGERAVRVRVDRSGRETARTRVGAGDRAGAALGI